MSFDEELIFRWLFFGILGLLCLAGFLVTINQSLSWLKPMEMSEKLKRSAIISIGSSVSLIAGLLIIFEILSPSTTSPWELFRFILSFFCVIPFGLAAFLGTFLNLHLFNWMGTKIPGVKKKDDEEFGIQERK